MALVYQNLTLEVTPGMLPPVLHVTEYDINMQIDVTFVQRGQPYEIPSGTTVKVEGTLAGHPFRESCTVNGNTVTFILTKNMTAYAGRAWTKIVLTNNTWPVSTCGFWLDCDRAGVEAATVIGAPGFQEQINQGVAEYFDNDPPFFELPENGQSGQALLSDGDGGAYWGQSGAGLTTEAKNALLACFENVAWKGTDGQTYYNALYAALNNEPAPPVPSGGYVTSGLLARWDGILNNGAGNEHSSDTPYWVDLVSGRALIPGTNPTQTWEANALVFNPGARYGTKNSLPGDIMQCAAFENPLTVEIVCQFDALSSGGTTIGEFGVSNSAQDMKYIAYSYGKKLLSVKNENGGHFTLQDLTTLKSVTVTYGSSIACYINGINVPASSDTNTWTGESQGVFTNMMLGGLPSYPFKGKIYSIRLYDRVLSASEIAKNHAVDVTRFELGS